MFRRWAENRMYRNTMVLAVQALRGAARTPNALEKLRLLEVAEQKLRDAHWLRPDLPGERFEAGLQEIGRSRQRSLEQQARPAVGRLLEAAEKGAGDRGEMLGVAAELLAFLYHYLPDDPETQQLGARFRRLGGEHAPYRPQPALADHYHRPGPGIGCGATVAAVVMALVLWWYAVMR